MAIALHGPLDENQTDEARALLFPDKEIAKLTTTIGWKAWMGLVETQTKSLNSQCMRDSAPPLTGVQLNVEEMSLLWGVRYFSDQGPI